MVHRNEDLGFVSVLYRYAMPDTFLDPNEAGLDPAEVEGLLEWFCYTKPIGHDMRIVVRPTSEEDSAFSVLAAGTEPEPPGSQCAKAG